MYPQYTVYWIDTQNISRIVSIFISYSVKQSDRNSSKMRLFNKLTTYEQLEKKHLLDSNTDKKKILELRLIRPLVQKLSPLKKCQS